MDNNFFKGEEPIGKRKKTVIAIVITVFIGVIFLVSGYYFKSNFFVSKNTSNTKLTDTDKQKLIRQILKNPSTISKSDRESTIENIEDSPPGVVSKEERQKTAGSLQVNK